MPLSLTDVPNSTRALASVDASAGDTITVSDKATALFVLFDSHKGEVKGPGASDDWAPVAADTWTLVGEWGRSLSGSRVINVRRHGGSGTVTVYARQS